MSASLRTWEAGGKPVSYAQPIADLAATLRARGYVVGTIGNNAHMTADPPEDHCPFSATGWPNPNPYPFVHALDIMPPGANSGLPPLAQVGARILADRNAGAAGIGWLKYMNWTDGNGSCHHEKWQPNHVQASSSDIGHIHLSCRTDFTHSPAATGYDPSARAGALPAPASSPAAGGAPPYPGGLYSYRPGQHIAYSATVRMWQQRAGIAADGLYGPTSRLMCVAIQRAHRLAQDGILGPLTWRATWSGNT